MTMQKLAKKFIEVMTDCSHIAKNGTNSFHGYKYATSADVLEKVNASLTKHGIASIAAPELISLQDVTTAKGNIEHLATVKMTVTLVDMESGETFSLVGLGSGQDSGDKAVMKAQTASMKYAYLLSLAISTGDDPEADTRTDENSAGAQASAGAPRQWQKAAPVAGTSVCADCGAPITPKVQSFSMSKYGRPLCMNCQKGAARSA